MTAADVRADFQATLIPGTTLIPAMVGEVTRAQQHGFSLVFVPLFTP
jgi:intracellular sulfur oxidation DsrE/DsrF family protein